MTDDLREPRYKIGDIASATGVAGNTIRTWLKRGDLTIDSADVASPGNKVAGRFTGRTAMVVGIMGALTSQGISPKVAAMAAAAFSYTGWESERSPGHLFPEGQTYLVVGAARWGVVNVMNESEYPRLFDRAFSAGAIYPAVTVLPLGEFVDTVRHGLGLPRDPLSKPTSNVEER